MQNMFDWEPIYYNTTNVSDWSSYVYQKGGRSVIDNYFFLKLDDKNQQYSYLTEV